MFATPEEQLRMARRRNIDRQWGFAETAFEILDRTPVPMYSRLARVVLNVSLGTVGETFEEAWEAATSVQDHSWRSASINSSSESLRLMAGKKHKRGLRWQVIDLGVNRNARPVAVRKVSDPVDSAIVWMAFYSPKWVHAMDGVAVPYAFLAGYECCGPGFAAWAALPGLSWDGDLRRVILDVYGARSRGRGWAIPAERGP